jgi:hypothetical protein
VGIQKTQQWVPIQNKDGGFTMQVQELPDEPADDAPEEEVGGVDTEHDWSPALVRDIESYNSDDPDEVFVMRHFVELIDAYQTSPFTSDHAERFSALLKRVIDPLDSGGLISFRDIGFQLGNKSNGTGAESFIADLKACCTHLVKLYNEGVDPEEIEGDLKEEGKSSAGTEEIKGVVPNAEDF